MAWASSPTQVSPAPPGRSSRDDVRLHRVHVLVLVDQHRVEQPAQRRPGGRVGQRRPPQQQQVIEVDQAVRPLVRPVGPEQAAELGRELRAPRVAGRDDLAPAACRCSRSGCRCRRRSTARGARRRVPTRSCSARSVSSTSVTSAGSMTLNSGGSANDSACARMIRCAMAWKVPPQIRSAAGASGGQARASMSSAALRVKVSSRIRLAGMPCSRSQAARATSVPVFPVPAPARISSGPPSCAAAARCSSFRPASAPGAVTAGPSQAARSWPGM